MRTWWRRRSFFCSRRLRLVIGDDAPDRRQNLLHRGFLNLCRLRHFRSHLINALESVFTPSEAGICWFRIDRFGNSSRRPDLSPDKRRPTHRTTFAPPGTPTFRPKNPMRCESPCCLKERYVRATNDCKQRHELRKARGRCREKRESATLQAGHSLARSCNSMATISGRQVYERQTSCHAPAGNARSDHRSGSPD